MKPIIGCLVALYGAVLFGFIPAIPSIVKDMFENRNKTPRTVYTFVHHVPSGQSGTEIEEQAIEDKGKVFSIFRVGNQYISSLFDSKTYQFGKDKLVPARSSLFLYYYLLVNDETFTNALVQEGFARRDQLNQLKPGLPATGWNLKDYYMRQEDIFLSRLPQGLAILVQGSLESDHQRNIYFDKNRRQLLKLEWKEGKESSYWTFSPVTRFSYGYFPREAKYFENDREIFQTDFEGIKNFNEKSFSDWKNRWKANLSKINVENLTFLKQLVTYR